MPKSLMLGLAVLCCFVGVAWLALAMEEHRHQARGTDARKTALRPARATAVALRLLGALAIGTSLLLCMRTDHATMAVLVWVMALAIASVLVALVLAWRPRWLGWLAGG